MKTPRLMLAFACALAGCQRDAAPTEPAATTATAAVPAVAVATATPTAAASTEPYTYPAPVEGHFDYESNFGSFDLVDGFAYPDPDGRGTVVMALSKPVASPLLTDPRCVLERMQVLAMIRNAGYVQVTIDEKGVSPYFGYGWFIGATGSDGSPPESKYWRTSLERDGDRVKGEAMHRLRKGFSYDLPLGAKPIPPDNLEPEIEPMLEAYRRIRTAVLAGDLVETLKIQGFTPEQIDAIRRLPGIDADFAAFKQRFLEPGEPKPDDMRPGDFYVDGKTPDGKHLWSRYGLVQCADWLVLNTISEVEL